MRNTNKLSGITATALIAALIFSAAFASCKSGGGGIGGTYTLNLSEKQQIH